MAWIAFAAGAALFWGMYGPTIHLGQVGLGGALKAFLCVGGAYFVMAVIVPSIMLAVQGEAAAPAAEGGNFWRGVGFAALAGAFGALGALMVIFAFKAGGRPIYVMPLVFGGAPVVNAVYSMLLHPPKEGMNPLFIAGLAVTAMGAAMVLYFKPA